MKKTLDDISDIHIISDIIYKYVCVLCIFI